MLASLSVLIGGAAFKAHDGLGLQPCRSIKVKYWEVMELGLRLGD
jgi:hypothetical protein